MKRYAEVSHIPARARLGFTARRAGDHLRRLAWQARKLIPGTSSGHALSWEPRRGWVIRPNSGLRTLSWTTPVAATTAYGPDDSGAAGTWSMQVLGIE